MEKYDRLAYLTRHYYDLQGLRLAPLWFAGSLIAPIRSQFGFAGRVAIIIGVLIVLPLWFWQMGRYYRMHFGWLKPDLPLFARRTPVRWFQWVLLIAFFAVLVMPGIISSRPGRPSTWIPFYIAFTVSIFFLIRKPREQERSVVARA